MLYQLSYSREPQSHRSELNRRPLDYESSALPLSYGGTAVTSGAEGTRTPGLLGAIQALSQLSYSPVHFLRPRGALRPFARAAWAREDSNL